MKQVIRIMDMPDKVIAFDELPEELLAPFEMLNCSKLPRHWRDYIGERERLIKIKPERDPITGQMRTYATVSEKGPFVWVVDRELIPQQEAWSEIESYVKRNAPKNFRLTDPIVDIKTGKSSMAKKMGADAHSELNLEPEDVIIIPLAKEEKETSSVSVVPDASQPNEIAVPEAIASENTTGSMQCQACGKTYLNERGLYLHKKRMHPIKVKEKVTIG